MGCVSDTHRVDLLLLVNQLTTHNTDLQLQPLADAAFWLSAFSPTFGLVQVCVHLSNVLMFAGTLPDSWAGAEAFPLLTDLTLADLPFQTGSLPTAWANNGSFPVLNYLMIGSSVLENISLSGSLPTEWGHPDAFKHLQSLNLGGYFTGTHSSTERSSISGPCHAGCAQSAHAV